MKLKLTIALCMLTILLTASGQTCEWPQSGNEVKPWTRWWWPGNAVDRENISRELREMETAGIGGVEITSIYGVKGEEHRSIEYLSPAFTEMLKFTIAEATRLGMGVDLPPGSGWRLGGPFVPKDKGLSTLKIKSYELAKGQQWKSPPDVQDVVLSTFVKETGEIIVPEPSAQFTSPEKGMLYIAHAQKNGDQVKRASDGGKGLAIDTFNEDILKWYLNEFHQKLNLEDQLIRCYFHDSFEYTGDFTTRFIEEFNERRGYDLAAYLHVLADTNEDTDMLERVRSDYRQTLGELVLDSFIAPMTQWANDHGSLTRNQAHGSPGNVLDLYAACNIPETEIFGKVEPGTADVFVNKFASSAAHITGRKLVSAESFTWLDEHWNVTPADMMRATNRLLLSGVNHMIFHGTCYSPEEAEWPGWLFYASSQINNRNPLWRELPTLFKYIERSQTILQQAEPQNDLLVYWPYYDVIAREGNRLYFSLNIDKGDKASWFQDYPLAELSRELTDAGYGIDYISDKQLLNCNIINGKVHTQGGATYEAVVVPEVKYMPVATIRKLKDFIANGGKVYFDNALPTSVPGMHNLSEREQHLHEITHTLPDAVRVTQQLAHEGIMGEQSIKEKGFHYLKMNLEDEIWYMVFNCSEELRDEWVHLNHHSEEFLFYHPERGTITSAASENDSVRIRLEPERVVFIRCTNKTTDAPDYFYADTNHEPIEIKGLWKITFMEGGPVYPGDVSTNELISWTQIGDEHTFCFAGTARYSTEFLWNDSIPAALLNLGKVNDCVRVKLNGKDYGTLFGPAFILPVHNLVTGKNVLELEVTNIAANRIRELDIRKADWKKFHDINFVNINYQPFDAAVWEIQEAGLAGPVKITPIPDK